MTITQIKSDLDTNGWTIFDGKNTDDEILIFSRVFGTIIPDDNGNAIQHLKPKQANSGIKNSFSFNFGYSAFPFHTDTAYWPSPSRYILLSSEKKSNCNTFLFDFNKILEKLSSQDLLTFKRSVFLQNIYSMNKLCSLIINDNGQFGIRFDPNIMSPYNKSAKISCEIIKKALNEYTPIQIEWTGKNILIVDNWRFLHSRGDSTNEPDRILKRIYLNN